MNIKEFPNPKLNLPKEFKKTDKRRDLSFGAIENYLDLVSEYIYTDINHDYRPSDSNHIHSYIQKIMSANVLRSLYLRNTFVDEFNSRNIVGLFLPLKAWFEVVGSLASILDLLERNLSTEDLFNELQPYVLGNRGKGNLRVGKIEAISVAKMIKNADNYIKKLAEKKIEIFKNKGSDNFFTDFYDMASNPSHPSFDSYELVGFLQDNGIWKAKKPDEVKKMIIEDIDGYGGLLMSPLFIKNICEKIFKIEAEHFDKLGSQKYFNQK